MANLQACGEPPSRSSSEIHRKSKVFRYFDRFLASSSMPHGLAASIDVMEEQEVYRLIGDEGFARLVSAFYRRVPHDDLLGPMYGETISPAPNIASATFWSSGSEDLRDISKRAAIPDCACGTPAAFLTATCPT